VRAVEFIVLHCTGASANQSTDSIKKHWSEVLKWKTMGYHYLVSVDGSFEQLLPIEKTSNGVKGVNATSIHICYKGGLGGVDTRTEPQKETLEMLVKQMKAKFPDAEIKGHRDFPNVKKYCPSFEVQDWLQTINL
jgi:N-acetylmuramoyl-L-alanine amidase